MRIGLITMSIFLPFYAFSWGGYDSDSGSNIEIEKGTLVRPGETIDVYDYDSGDYKTVDVESVTSDEVEVYDSNSGEYKTYDMDLY